MQNVIEVAVVFDTEGQPIEWYIPPNGSGVYIPDSRSLWDILWDNRERLGGVAHTHPFYGHPGPSQTDETTFSAVERGLGKRLLWPIVTFNEVAIYQWDPEIVAYARIIRCPLGVVTIDRLRELSREVSHG